MVNEHSLSLSLLYATTTHHHHESERGASAQQLQKITCTSTAFVMWLILQRSRITVQYNQRWDVSCVSERTFLRAALQLQASTSTEVVGGYYATTIEDRGWAKLRNDLWSLHCTQGSKPSGEKHRLPYPGPLPLLLFWDLTQLPHGR